MVQQEGVLTYEVEEVLVTRFLYKQMSICGQVIFGEGFRVEQRLSNSAFHAASYCNVSH